MSRRSAVPAYCHHKPSNRAYVYLNRKKVYLGPYGSAKSKKEYRRLLSEREVMPVGVELSTIRIHAAPDLTVEELALGYVQHAVAYYRKPSGEPTSEIASINIAIDVASDLYGHAPVAEFGPLALKAVRQKMIEKNWARTTINQNVARLVRMFRWGVENELVVAAVLQALKAVPGLRAGRSAAKEPEPVRPVPDKVVNKTLVHLPPPVAAMVRLQRLTGMRPGEVCRMRPCDVDQSGDVWLYKQSTHKTQHLGKGRFVALGPRAQEVLAPFLANRPATAQCFSPAEAMAAMHEKRSTNRKTPLHYGNRAGTNRQPCPKRAPKSAYTRESYTRAIARGCELAFGMPAELKDPNGKRRRTETSAQKQERQRHAAAWRAVHCWSPNQLRHAAATALRREFGIEAASVVLGHTDPNTTLIYAERDAERACEIAKKVG